MEPQHVRQAISTFLNLHPELQFEVLASVQRNAFLVPRLTESRDAAQAHWNEVRGTGAGAVFSMRIAAMPHEPSPAYVVKKELSSYLNRLYVGGDVAAYGSMDFRSGGSDELEAILADAVAKGESVVNLGGVVKCEAMGFLLRYGLGTMDNPVGMVDGNPFVGTIDLTLSLDFIKHMTNTEGYTLKQFAIDHHGHTSPAELMATAETDSEVSV
jgi:hypothetical protein